MIIFHPYQMMVSVELHNWKDTQTHMDWKNARLLLMQNRFIRRWCKMKCCSLQPAEKSKIKMSYLLMHFHFSCNAIFFLTSWQLHVFKSNFVNLLLGNWPIEGFYVIIIRLWRQIEQDSTHRNVIFDKLKLTAFKNI